MNSKDGADGGPEVVDEVVAAHTQPQPQPHHAEMVPFTGSLSLGAKYYGMRKEAQREKERRTPLPVDDSGFEMRVLKE